MKFENLGLTDLSDTEALNVNAGRVLDFFIDYLAEKVVDALIDGFNKANSGPAPTITSHVFNCGPY